MISHFGAVHPIYKVLNEEAIEKWKNQLVFVFICTSREGAGCELH